MKRNETNKIVKETKKRRRKEEFVFKIKEMKRSKK